MKSTPRRLLALVLVLLALPVVAAAEASTWTVDRTHSDVAFQVRHFLTPVRGEFNDFEGVVVYDPENPAASRVEVTVQAASIDTDNERRDGHLRSDDFFAAETHPTLTFKSKKVEQGADGLAVTGELTIRGVTKEVTVPVEVLGVMGDKAGFSTRFVVDRLDYGVSWNNVLDQGGAVLGDEVTIDLNFELDRQKEDTQAQG